MESYFSRQHSHRAKYIHFHCNSFLKVTKDLEALERALTCPVCDQLFSRPYILPCGHSICYSCVTRMTEIAKKTNPDVLTNHLQIKCPVCDFNLTIEEYMENAPRNRAVENAVVSLIDILKTATPLEENVFHVNSCAAGGDGDHMEGSSKYIPTNPTLAKDMGAAENYNTPLLQRESPMQDHSIDLLCEIQDRTGDENLATTAKDESRNPYKEWKFIKTPKELIKKMISKIRERKTNRKFKNNRYTLIFNDMDY